MKKSLSALLMLCIAAPVPAQSLRGSQASVQKMYTRAVLNDLFKALLYKLMTGEIHVSDLDLSVLAEQPEDVAA